MRARVTTQGRVTIPRALRKLLRIRPGTGVEFQRAGEHCAIVSRADGRPWRTQLPRYCAERLARAMGITTREAMRLLRGSHS